MNLLIFEADELQDSKLLLRERRAKHLIKVLGSVPGDRIRVGMLGGKTGFAKVIAITASEVELAVELTDAPSQRPEINLILALPRPIMLQRILKQATVLGVTNFHLIRSRRVEKSFFQSPVLKPDKIKSLLLEGLEQAMDTRLPQVEIHTRFKPFVEDVVPTLSASNRLIAHPTATSNLVGHLEMIQPDQAITLAIGPEGGWSDFETGKFIEQGFADFSMGPRILHVDTAVVALLAQLNIIQDVQDFLKR